VARRRVGLGHHVEVARQQPHRVVHAHELHDLLPARTIDRIGHQAAQHEGLTDAGIELG
jgi:hypothetical protein